MIGSSSLITPQNEPVVVPITWVVAANNTSPVVNISMSQVNPPPASNSSNPTARVSGAVRYISPESAKKFAPTHELVTPMKPVVSITFEWVGSASNEKPGIRAPGVHTGSLVNSFQGSG